MSDGPGPAELFRTIAQDLRPVRPLPAPERRALALAPLGVMLLVGSPSFWGWRGNLAMLDPSVSWGLSIVQGIVGVLIVGAALREAVPGRTLSGVTLAATIAGAATLVLAITAVTHAVLETPEPAAIWLGSVLICLQTSLLSGLPAVAITVALAARALPSRPAVAGALCGLGAALMTDAGMRLYCNVSTPAHVLVAHGGGLIGLSLAGALLATIVDWATRPTAHGRRPTADSR
jgi:hypothetical protein